MNRKRIRWLSVLLAVITVFSVTGTAFSAAEADVAPAAGEVGSDLAATGDIQPEFTSMENTKDGVLMRWKKLDNIHFYRIYRWFDDGRGWVKLHDTDLLQYTDTSVAGGNTYKYRLVGISADGDILTGTAVRSIEYYGYIMITNAESVETGVKLTWNKVPGMSKTAVYRKDNGSWRRITTSTGTTYTDTAAAVGGTYTYTVRSLDANGAFLYDYYDKVGMTHSYLAIPSVSVQNAVDGVKVSWKKVAGAAKYRVFRKTGSGSWTRAAVTADTSVVDKEVSSGKTYIYTVRCVTEDEARYTSYFDKTGKSIQYVAAPVLVSAQGTVDGIKVTWKKSEGAAKYRVFRKNAQGSWVRVADTAGTSYEDKDVTSGVNTTYTVRCLNSSGSYISAHYAGISGVYLSAPEFTLSQTVDSVKISWKAINGAENYRVYRYGANGWVKLADTTASSYLDTTVTSGNEYKYTVRCINAQGNAFTSGYHPGKSIKFVTAPRITSLVNAADGVKVTWEAVAGAEKYRLYYYATTGWQRIADLTGTTYLDESAVSGTTRRYTVRCINNAGTAFLSAYRDGEEITYVDAPNFKLTRNEKSITISWDKVQGASMYRVFIQGENGWKKLADISGTSYEDKNVVSGRTYTYTVCCLDADTDAAISSQLEGKSIKIVDMPKVSSVTCGETGVDIRWNAVQGASKYRVYMKNGTGWTKIGETAEHEFTHTDAESGKDYTYTVRCINEEGTAFESSFDSVGKSIHYIATPQNLKANNEGSGIKISWTASAGAAKYRVYRYGTNGWVKLGDTTDTSYIDTNVVSGTDYRYTVRCLSADSKSFTSNFNHEGVTCKHTYTPQLYPLELAKDGVVISWKESQGSDKYRVYSYGENGWTKIAETTETSIIDKSVSSGKTYRYTVRCISADSKSFTSDYDHTGVSIFYVSPPKLLTMESDTEKVVFTWSKPRGAEKYRVYKKVNGAWKKLTDTYANSYTDKNITVGSTYTYTVRVINSEGTQFYSSYDPSGFAVTVTADVSDFVYYDQGQYNYPYGDDTIAYSGCGPTCFAMIASTLTGRSITPIDAVAWCGNSFYLMGVGTYWSYFAEAANYFGIKMEKQVGPESFDTTVINALKQGKYVISAQSAGRFTRGGHFIVLAGITSDGQIIVYDPNGGNHYVGTAFDPSEITASGTQYWIFNKK